MDFYLEPGKYVVAVSGGVDSVVLLDLLSKKPDLELVVAHFDHGIRPDSTKDRRFVESLAEKYGLLFFYDEGRLGPGASEAMAREKRYEFLRKVKNKTNSKAIVTAHHQDDLLETVVLNLLRGTKHKGLSSLKSTAEIKRPLLTFRKQQIQNYARQNNLAWHEDATNADEKYLRNYIRLNIMPKFDDQARSRLLALIDSSRQASTEIDKLLAQALRAQPNHNQLDRQWFASLPHTVAAEIMAAWLRQNDVEFDKKTIERAVRGAKTLPGGKSIDLSKRAKIVIKAKALALADLDR